MIHMSRRPLSRCGSGSYWTRDVTVTPSCQRAPPLPVPDPATRLRQNSMTPSGDSESPPSSQPDSTPLDDRLPSSAVDRLDIAAALQSLFSSLSSPVTHTSACTGPDSDTTDAALAHLSLDPSPPPSMRTPRTPAAPTKFPTKAVLPSSAQTSPAYSPTSPSMNLSHPPSPAAQSSPSQNRNRASQPSIPILRWFSVKNASKPSSNSNPDSPLRSRPPTPAANSSDTPGPSTPTTPSSALSVLADAFSDDPHIISRSQTHSDDIKLPSRPEAARLHSALQRPSYFSNLTRTTMPTAFLSPPAPHSYARPTYSDPFEDPFARPLHDQQRDRERSDLDLLLSPTPVPLPMPYSPSPVHLNSSPPSRTSLESLRSIHERSRSIHMTAPAQGFNFPQLPNLRNWFSSDEASDKENLNPMLSDEDRGETSAAERENIRRKCMLPSLACMCPASFDHGSRLSD